MKYRPYVVHNFTNKYPTLDPVCNYGKECFKMKCIF